MATQASTNKGTKKMATFFKGVKSEMRKVSWPSRKQLLNHTTVVIGVCALMAILVAIVDQGLLKLLSLIVQID